MPEVERRLKASKSSLIRYQSHLKFDGIPLSSILSLNSHASSPLLHNDDTLYDILDRDAPEVIMSKNGFLRKNLGRFLQLPPIGLADVRRSFRLNRKENRVDSPHYFATHLLFQFRQGQLRIKEYFEKNAWILSLFALLLETLQCVMYLSEMQLNISNPCIDLNCGTNLPSWIVINREDGSFQGLIAISIMKLLLVSLRATMTDKSLAYLFRFERLIDIGTTFPFLVLGSMSGGKFVFVPYFLQCILFVSSLQELLKFRFKQKLINFNTMTEKLILMIVIIWSIIYFGVCTFNFSETHFPGQRASSNSKLSLLDTFYFIVITICTVGYGDITPTSIPGQIVVIVLIIGGVTIIPSLVTDFQAAVKLFEAGGESFVPGRSPFIVICGKFDNGNRILDLVKNVCSKDSNKSFNVVLLSLGRFSQDVNEKLKKSKLSNRIFYVAGSGLDVKDLMRASVQKASSAIIIAELARKNEEKKLEDENNTLRVYAFTDYAPKVPLYVETLLPDTADLQEDLGLHPGSICISDVAQTFLAYNCLYRGVATLMINLIRGVRKPPDSDKIWHEQFGDGMKSEIFRIEVKQMFVGESFQSLASYLHKEFQVILFGAHIYIDYEDTFYISLNPGKKFAFQKRDYLFVIANSYDDIKAIETLTYTQFKKSEDVIYDARESISSLISRNFVYDVPIQRPKDQFVNGYPDQMRKSHKIPKCLLLPESALLENSVLESTSHLQHFILVLTRSYDVLRFLVTLRNVNLTPSEFKPIVFLSSVLPTEEEFKKLSIFPEIYYIRGDVKKMSHLKKAGVLEAEKIVVLDLSDPAIPCSDQNSIDSANILVFNLIQKMLKDEGSRKHVITLLRLQGSIKFLSSSKQMLMQSSKDIVYSPAVASGQCLTTMMLESIVSSSCHQPYLSEMFRGFCGVPFSIPEDVVRDYHIKTSNLCYTVIPPEFYGKTFGLLFMFLVETQGVVAIGLLREGEDISLPFVYTNPPYSLLLKGTDLVYCLAHALAVT